MRNSFDARVSYDANADTLYIYSVDPISVVRSVEDGRGIVWRYAEDGQVVGATVMDFHDFWAERPDELASELALRFGVARIVAAAIVDLAKQSGRPNWLT